MFTQAEIGDGDPASALVQHHITKLQISMNNVFLSKEKQDEFHIIGISIFIK